MIDIVLIVTFFYLVLTGFYHGFSYISIRFIGIALGAYVAYTYRGFLVSGLGKLLDWNEKILDVFSFSLIFSLFLILSFSLKFIIKDKIEKNESFIMIDRIAGGILGVILFLALVSFLVVHSFQDGVIKELTENSFIIKNLQPYYQNFNMD